MIIPGDTFVRAHDLRVRPGLALEFAPVVSRGQERESDKLAQLALGCLSEVVDEVRWGIKTVRS